MNEDGEFVGQRTTDHRAWSYSQADMYVALPAGTYTISIQIVTGNQDASFSLQIISEAGTNFVTLENSGQSGTFTLQDNTRLGIMFKPYRATVQVMLNEGSEPSRFTKYDYYKSPNYVVIKDMNNVGVGLQRVSYTFAVMSNASNAPGANAGMMFGCDNSSDYAQQIFAGDNADMYIRSKRDTVGWSSWKTIA